MKPGFAEQEPELWWEHVKAAIQILKQQCDLQCVRAIGITYQMHGLVCLDGTGKSLRPAIIWCDSRAVDLGKLAYQELGEDFCLKNLLNSPGNFTAAKLAWVKQFEPEIYSKIAKVMLPGDFIRYKLCGEICTTESGLSEGVLWDFKKSAISKELCNFFEFNADLIPPVFKNISTQGELLPEIAAELGLPKATPIGFCAGDQPTNAFALNVLQPGEAAANAGTSGVIYAVTENIKPDPSSRVNTFLHLTNSAAASRLGVLLCINGCGILNSWVQKNIFSSPAKLSSYTELNDLAAQVPIGARGLSLLPYGNGAERSLENKLIGASLHGLDLNLHQRPEIARAAQEGIAFALAYGFEVMRGLGLQPDCVRACQASLFQSPLFQEAFAYSTNTRLELYATDGAQGAARGAGVGTGLYRDYSEAFASLKCLTSQAPQDQEKRAAYTEAYSHWKSYLNLYL